MVYDKIMVIKRKVEKMLNIFHRLLNLEKLSDTQKIALSFVLVIMVGTCLLSLPIANESRTWLSLIDALFMATSATCVTGLGVVPLVGTFTLFGKIVMLILIQIGGLGLMTLMALFVSFMKKRLSIRETRLMKEMLNSSSQLNMRKFIKDIISYVAFFEGIGALLLMFVLIPDFGWKEGIFHSVFLSVSAFCNAGFDTLGASSLMPYANHYYVISVIAMLVMIGGIGFAVWFDIRDRIQLLIRKEITWSKLISLLSLHTRIVVGFSLFLIVVPAILWLVIEFNNPLTIGTYSFFDKLYTACVEMTFLRTAGFTTFAYSGLKDASALLMMVIMFIGGSPGGTAGGIKTTTVFVILLYMRSLLSGSTQTIFKKRSIAKGTIITAMGILFLNIVVLLIGMFLLSLTQIQSFIQLSFEAVSALATVGSTLGITSLLTTSGKVVVIMMMYIGRIGITTLLLSVIRYDSNDAKNAIMYPEADIVVG